jgi:drug/metabolite transporter (DMT)-like permease
VVSIGVGGGALLTGGCALHGLPVLQPIHWLVIAWLAVVNSAVAFTLWNRTVQTLAAVESSIINNTMLIQIAILAWLFLGEELTALKILGLVAASVGTLIAQMRLTRR